MNNYAKNIEAINKLNPDFAAMLNKAEPVDWAYTEPADGYEELCIKDGVRTKTVYNRDPMSVIDEALKQTDLFAQNASVIIGAGLGHAVTRLLETAEKGHQVILVEPVLHILRLALERYDWSKLLKDKKLFICTDSYSAVQMLGLLDSGRVVEGWNVHAEPYVTYRPEYLQLSEDILNAISALRCNVGTLISSGMAIAKNDIETLPYVIRHRGVAELKDLYKGKPAVLVSTGPSLGRNIHLLREAQDRVIIVAVGQALRPLLAYGIRPDFICTVDFGEVNFAHFEGLLDSDVPMVTLNRTYAPLVQAYKGPKFISAGTDTLHGIFKDKGLIEQGGSVAHMCLGLAVSMGCNPVIFMGQDLALSEESHFRQVDNMGSVKVTAEGEIKWAVEDPGSKLAGNTHSMGGQVMVKGYYGPLVLTNSGLLSFHTAFENMIMICNANRIKVINATEGGARLRGTEALFLFEALERHAKKDINPHLGKQGIVAPLLSLADDAEALIDEAVKLLKKDVKAIQEIMSLTDKGIDTGKQILKAYTKTRIKVLLKENEEHSKAAHAIAKKLQPVSLAIYSASRALYSRAMKLDLTIPPEELIHKRNRKELTHRINRNNHILTAAKAAAKELQGPYETALYGLTMHKDGVSLEPTGETSTPDLAKAKEYLKTGNWAWPLLEARRALKHDKAGTFTADINNIIAEAVLMREDATSLACESLRADIIDDRDTVPQYEMLIEEAGVAGRDFQDYEYSLGLLLKAHELNPEGEQALWGTATAYSHLCMYPESIAAYIKLIRLYPDDRYRFEKGQNLIKAGFVLVGLALIQKLMEHSSEFDHFFKVMGDIYVKLGRQGEARIAYEGYLQAYPGDRGVEEALAKLS